MDAYDDNEKWANSWAITESGMKFKKGLDDVLRNAFVEKDTTD